MMNGDNSQQQQSQLTQQPNAAAIQTAGLTPQQLQQYQQRKRVETLKRVLSPDDATKFDLLLNQYKKQEISKETFDAEYKRLVAPYAGLLQQQQKLLQEQQLQQQQLMRSSQHAQVSIPIQSTTQPAVQQPTTISTPPPPVTATPIQTPVPTTTNLTSTIPDLPWPQLSEEQKKNLFQECKNDKDKRKEIIKKYPEIINYIKEIKLQVEKQQKHQQLQQQLQQQQLTQQVQQNQQSQINPMFQPGGIFQTITSQQTQQPAVRTAASPVPTSKPTPTPTTTPTSTPTSGQKSAKQPPQKKQKTGKEGNRDPTQLDEITALAGIDLDEEYRYTGVVIRKSTVPLTDEPLLNKAPLKNKLQRIAKNKGLKTTVSDEVCDFMNFAVQDRLRTIIEGLMEIADHRFFTNAERCRHPVAITSDREHRFMEKESEKKQRVESERLRKKRESERLRLAEQQQASDEKRKNMNSKRQAEEEKRARMQSTNAAAMAMINLRPTKQAAQTVSPETPNANPSTPATSGDQNEDASGDAMTDEDQMTNRTNGRYTGKRPSSIVITKNDVLTYLEQDSQLCKSKLLHVVYLK